MALFPLACIGHHTALWWKGSHQEESRVQLSLGALHFSLSFSLFGADISLHQVYIPDGESLIQLGSLYLGLVWIEVTCLYQNSLDPVSSLHWAPKQTQARCSSCMMSSSFSVGFSIPLYVAPLHLSIWNSSTSSTRILLLPHGTTPSIPKIRLPFSHQGSLTVFLMKLLGSCLWTTLGPPPHAILFNSLQITS